MKVEAAELTRLRVVEIRSLYNQRICWILIASDLVLHALRFFHGG